MARRRFSLLRSISGIAMTEFALCLPFVVMLGTLGIEYTRYVVIKKRVSDMAAQIADNASRMGNASVLTNKPVSEAEINDLFVGATLEAGDAMDLPHKSRIILSSLEVNADNGQWIHWQRCFGSKNYPSSYGVQGDGQSGTGFAGMGRTGNKITAVKGSAVMFVEMAYSYTPVIGLLPVAMQDIVEVSAYNVRDSRDLTQVYPVTGVTASTC
ncbi:pilus assembly protein [Sphingobium amiense]|uniref:Pilus assembly protein n=1 Tax=Sphingobium amiense TaxID=135719 RepID=A0A494W7F5_9SPHN|nr:TadE family protein [Sphingobium amiense]BBD96540.1 pilus assembly protein [Sphingobium amiense]